MTHDVSADDGGSTDYDWDDDGRLPCRKCATPINPDADRCPACSYEGVAGTPLKSLKRRYWIARLLCIAIVGMPWLAYYTVRIRRARKRHPEWERPAMSPEEAGLDE